MSHLGITTQRFLHVVCILFLLLLVLLSSTTCQLSLDAITSNQPIRDGDFLVSSKKIFTLGFFTPGSSRHRYVGVWYTIDPNQIVVWVANRDNPINDSSGVLSITNDRGLVIHANSSSIDLWSSNVTLSSPNTCVAKLLDSGNLVLLESEKSGKLVWQGFDHPTDTLLPSMKIGLNRTAGWTRFLTSWKSRDDPGTGNCTHVLAPNGVPRFVLYRGGELKWRGSPWINDKWNDLPATNPGEFSVTIVNNDDETSYVLLAPKDSSILVRGMADEAGVFRRFMWNDQEKNWTNLVNYPSQLCDSYGQCGPNSHCDANKNYAVACTCLPGYEPKSPSDWNLTLWAGGCVRKSGVSVCQKGDGFVKVERMEVPDTPMARVNTSVSLKDCKAECLMNCSCMSYASADEEGDGYGCVTWYGDLMDTKTYSYTGQSNLYVRVDATTLAQYAKSKDPLIKKEMALVSSASVAVFLLLLLALCLLVRRNIEGERRRKRYAFILAPGSTYFEDSKGGTAFDDSRMNSELTFFHLKTIATATNNFSIENKLGEGGFGSVYKGILRDGNELAIKRLSKYSGQGVEEFKNEVLLIAKLQHRNLVRILGCCVEDEEKLLIYEYLPNKSLDGFIFGDETKRASLDWTRRFEIILGIARGVLYLHEDSRLRIIHRDLKTSNILLDNAFNPKIADFGMARIFRAEQNEANTNRVVGTYGYMSPEYAMRGLFSIKSDVYSFGIILLEIITGKKNAGYHHEGYPDSSMVGHVWELWKQGRSEDSIDSCIGEAYLVNEVERCIQIALLCVQEFPNDRPTMSAVVSMFGNDAALASPSQPAFTLKRLSNGELSGSEGGCFSVNELTCTIVQVR